MYLGDGDAVKYPKRDPSEIQVRTCNNISYTGILWLNSFFEKSLPTFLIAFEKNIANHVGIYAIISQVKTWAV